MSEIKADIIVPFIDATHATFKMMLGRELRRKEAYIKRNYVMYGDVSGTIGLSGAVTGVGSISVPAQMALDCVRELMGDEADAEINDTVVNDGVGEIINMIAGGAKTTLSSTDTPIDFTLPTIISGRGHELYQRQGTINVSIIFETDRGEEFALDISTQNK